MPSAAIMPDSTTDLLSDLLGDPVPSPEEPASAESIAPWRDRIDALDRVILRLLNERAVCAAAIGGIKKALALPVYVPTREQEVLRNALDSNGGPLSDEAVRRLFERIIDETRSLERHLVQEEKDRREESRGDGTV